MVHRRRRMPSRRFPAPITHVPKRTASQIRFRISRKPLPNPVKPEPNRNAIHRRDAEIAEISSASGCRRIEQAVTTRGDNSRPVGKPGDRPGPRGHPPRGAKAAPWDTQVSPQVCGIALREIPRVAGTGQRRAHATTASWWNGMGNPRANMPPRKGAWQPGRLLHGEWRARSKDLASSGKNPTR